MKKHFRLWGIVLFATIVQSRSAQTDLFPVSEALEPRVQFWEDIFSKYSQHQIVLYDSDHPERIFRVLDLDSTWSPQKRSSEIRKAINGIRFLLGQLTAGAYKSDSLRGDLFKIRQCFGDSVSAYDFRQSAAKIHAQDGAREPFLEGLRRSGKYLGIVRNVFKEEKLPEDLAFLAHVESAFNPEAKSYCGALGMWQLMKGTGKAHLSINNLLDERKDPILSARAAAGVLKENYQKTSVWPLAITAYNHGLNGVQRAVRVTGSKDIAVLIRTYRSNLWGNASKNFYAEFAAVRRICLNTENYFKNPDMAQALVFQEIRLPFSFYLKELAELYKVEQKTLIEMNPAFEPGIRSNRYKVPCGYHLRIPPHAKVLGANLITAPVIVP